MKPPLLLVLSALAEVACANDCFWNRKCPFLLQATKTPYFLARGDIRDFKTPHNCKAVSVWTLNRHGNSLTKELESIARLKDEIVASYEAGRGQLCAEDIDLFRSWTWRDNYTELQWNLTRTGYKELHDIGRRLREKYPHLLKGTEQDYYFRPFAAKWVVASGAAYLHGLTEGTNLSLTLDKPRERDDVIGTNKMCDRWVQTVNNSPWLRDQVDKYFNGPEFVSVQHAVQRRFGLTSQLSQSNILELYNLCRFDRSWSENYQSPWCAAFSDRDLVVLEYKDDLRHYYKNGYGSWVNVLLGRFPLKDLYKSFEAVVQGRGRKLTSYFVHNTNAQMTWCAMDIFKDPAPLQPTFRNVSRLWKTSNMGAFANNLIAVLNSCHESGIQTYRVQLFINEKVTEICPEEGCTWQQFQDKFQGFTSANLDFCSMDYKGPELVNGTFVNYEQRLANFGFSIQY